jgi:hypothetical protein
MHPPGHTNNHNSDHIEYKIFGEKRSNKILKSVHPDKKKAVNWIKNNGTQDNIYYLELWIGGERADKKFNTTKCATCKFAMISNKTYQTKWEYKLFEWRKDENSSFSKTHSMLPTISIQSIKPPSTSPSLLEKSLSMIKSDKLPTRSTSTLPTISNKFKIAAKSMLSH